MAGDEQAERDDQVRLSEDERLLRSYRYARTYPKTLRKLGGIELPWPVTVTQLAVWIAAFALLWYSLPVWGHLGSVTPLLLVAVPTGLAVAVHHLRLEGRSPLAMATGLASLLAAPRGGVLHGRPLRPSKFSIKREMSKTWRCYGYFAAWGSHEKRANIKPAPFREQAS